MAILHTIRTLAGDVTERFRDPGFSCGDCDRNARCGQPPTADCPIKLAELERDPLGHQRRMKARAKALLSTYWV